MSKGRADAARRFRILGGPAISSGTGHRTAGLDTVVSAVEVSTGPALERRLALSVERCRPSQLPWRSQASEAYLQDVCTLIYIYIYACIHTYISWRGDCCGVYQKHIQALIPARNSTQISHECADLCMRIITIPHFNCYEHDLQMATTLVLQVMSIR